MLVCEYADAWSFVLRDEDAHHSIAEVEVEEGIVAAFGTPVTKSSETIPPRLLELYFLKAFFDYMDADRVRKAMFVRVDRKKPDRPIEERIIVQDREVASVKEPPPVSRRLLDEHRERRRAVKRPPSEWQPWALLLFVVSTEQGEIARLSGTLAPSLARRIGEHLVSACRGITACSIGCRLYRSDDYFNEEVDVDHLARVLEEEARGRDPAVIDDLPLYTEQPLSTLLFPGGEGVTRLVSRVLSLVVNTWRDRAVITVVDSDGLQRMIHGGLGLDSGTLLAVDPMLLFPEDITDAVLDFQETLIENFEEEGEIAFF